MKMRSKLNTLAILMSFACLVLASCSGGSEGKVVVVKAGPPLEVGSVSKTTTLFQVDTVATLVNWVGRKPGGSHAGTLQMQSGYLEYTDQGLVGGRIVLNMATIADTDLSDQESKAKLEGHLKSPDFFNVAQFPTSDFVITKVTLGNSNDSSSFDVEGNLTIKGITKSIAFPAKVEVDGGVVVANVGPIAINRTDWGANYGSKSIYDNLKDKFIDDNIEVTIVLKTMK